MLLEVFNSCLREGRFFADWKEQRLFLLRKGNRPLGDASSYRPICLLDTMGKLLEEMILQRLQGHMVRENGLSENQFGFRKGRSTVNAIQAVVDIATKARRGTGKRKGTTGASRNRIGACTRGLASSVDLAVRVVQGRNRFIPPLAGAANQSA